jgi:hypothetical protein
MSDPYEELFRLEHRRGRRAPVIPRGHAGKGASKPSAASYRAALRRTIKRTPEVMVKISGGARTAHGVEAHVAYIARSDASAERADKEAVSFEDEEGNRYCGKEDVAEIMERWRNGRQPLRRSGEKTPKQVYNIILSMPPGTPRAGVEKAARQFARERFEKHEYILAAHADEAHPHVHLCVKAIDREGHRLNPRKKDLQAWRSHFAERLRDEGIAANATPRKTRGVVRRPVKQAIRQMDNEYRAGRRTRPSRASAGRGKLLREAQARQHCLYETHDNDGQRHRSTVNPLARQIAEGRSRTMHAYAQIAQELMQSPNAEDRQLALDVARFVQSMPPPKTWMETNMERRSRDAGKNWPLDAQRPSPDKDGGLGDKDKDR